MKDKSAFSKRAARLREGLVAQRLGGVVIVPGPNLRYFTEVESMLLERPFMLLFPAEGSPQLVAPELESGPYRECPLPMQIHSWTDSQGPVGAIRAAAKEARVGGSWGVEGKAPFLFLDRLMKASSPKLKDAEPVLQGLREVKDEAEVKLLKKSARILSKSFGGFPELVKEGKTEAEVAKEATDLIYSNGATKVDGMLVQSGPRAADPHSGPSGRRIRRGEGVLFDVGSTFEGYYADITRTICVGKTPDLERVYEKVLEAEVKGIQAAGEGVEVGKVDAAARGLLRKAGMGKYFIHRTGHGLGREIHEAPYIVEGGKEKLRGNMCFTVEPGVYMAGKLGVRIEDNVLIEGKRGSSLTDTPKEFGWWA
jgi:Xaa-Pro aminopeptidase